MPSIGTQSLRSFGPSHFVGPSPYPCPGVDTSSGGHVTYLFPKIAVPIRMMVAP